MPQSKLNEICPPPASTLSRYHRCSYITSYGSPAFEGLELSKNYIEWNLGTYPSYHITPSCSTQLIDNHSWID